MVRRCLAAAPSHSAGRRRHTIARARLGRRPAADTLPAWRAVEGADLGLCLPPAARAGARALRGHGDSDRASDYALESHVADIGAVLDALGWQQAHLVGMSFGGLIAAHLAASAPHRVSSL